jgi:hypothetical protein
MSLLTVKMLKDWVGWLKAGQEYELDYQLAIMLIGLKKAKYSGDAIDLFKGFGDNNNKAESQKEDKIWLT